MEKGHVYEPVEPSQRQRGCQIPAEHIRLPPPGPLGVIIGRLVIRMVSSVVQDDVVTSDFFLVELIHHLQSDKEMLKVIRSVC